MNKNFLCSILPTRATVRFAAALVALTLPAVTTSPTALCAYDCICSASGGSIGAIRANGTNLGYSASCSDCQSACMQRQTAVPPYPFFAWAGDYGAANDWTTCYNLESPSKRGSTRK